MKRLEKIHQTYGDGKMPTAGAQTDEKVDEFTATKRRIAKQLKQVREEITTRNELLDGRGNDVSTVKMSAQIRSKIKEISNEQQQLEAFIQKENEKIEKKKAAGKEVKEERITANERRVEVAELCKKHIEECKLLERSGFIKDNNLLYVDDNRSNPTISKLPDIDEEGFQLLKRNDAVIDAQLTVLEGGVGVLKNMAIDIGRELDTHTVLVAELDRDMDAAQSHLNELNVRLKKTLTSVRKGDRFIIDLILLIILLGLIGYIYNVVQKQK